MRAWPARSRPALRQARLAVLSFIAAFVLGQVGGTLLVDACPVEIRFPELAGVMRAAGASPRAHDVVLLGSSRLGAVPAPRVGLASAHDPPLRVLNASVRAGDPIAYDRVLARLTADGRTPRLAIVELNPEMLTPGYRWLRASVTRFFTWRDVARWPAVLARSRSLNEAIGSRFAPFYKFRGELWTWAGDVAGIRRDGAPPAGGNTMPGPIAGPLATDAEIRRVAAPAAALISPWMIDYGVDGPEAEALVTLLERCARANIAVIVLAPPATSVLRDLYAPEVERRFQTFIVELSSRYGFRFADYRARLADRFFQDVYHVRPAGGVALADLLGREVVGPAWTRLASTSRP